MRHFERSAEMTSDIILLPHVAVVNENGLESEGEQLFGAPSRKGAQELLFNQQRLCQSQRSLIETLKLLIPSFIAGK